MAANAYTAEIVDFDLVPERYAKKVDFVTAEITLNITKDWQHIVELWFKSDIGDRYKDLMCDAQYTVLQFDRAEGSGGTLNTREAKKRMINDAQCTNAIANKIDKSIVQTLLYSIMSISGYFDGTGSGKLSSSDSSTSMSKQFEHTLEAIIDNMSAAGTNGADTINVDSDKVTDDLKTINVGGTRLSMVTTRTVDDGASVSFGKKMSIDTDSAITDGSNPLTHDSDDNKDVIDYINALWPRVMARREVGENPFVGPMYECEDEPARLSTDDSLRTSTLGGLINAKAFLPVVNRLIRGGAFFVNTVQGEGHEYSSLVERPTTTGAATDPLLGLYYRLSTEQDDMLQMRKERKFNPAREFRKTGSDGTTVTMGRRGEDGTDLHMIDYNSQLAFPVKVKVGGILAQDGNGGADGNTDAGGNTTVPTGSDGNHLNFQINLVLQAAALAEVAA